MKHLCELRFRSHWAFTYASLSAFPFALVGLFLFTFIIFVSFLSFTFCLNSFSCFSLSHAGLNCQIFSAKRVLYLMCLIIYYFYLFSKFFMLDFSIFYLEAVIRHILHLIKSLCCVCVL